MARDYLTVADVLGMHRVLIQRYGGALGVRDPGALEAALFRPQTGYYDDIVGCVDSHTLRGREMAKPRDVLPGQDGRKTPNERPRDAMTEARSRMARRLCQKTEAPKETRMAVESLPTFTKPARQRWDLNLGPTFTAEGLYLN